MKKYVLFLLALVFGCGMIQAKPVDVNEAKNVGQKFVQANFDLARQGVDLNLVYTATSTKGSACFYVFNVGEEGFVIVSAEDSYRPIVGYSNEGAFDVDNMSPELSYYLGTIENRIEVLMGTVAVPEIANEWQAILGNGKMISRNGGRSVEKLCITKWNQDYPYNYYCPANSAGPGGRTYAGCVATAMSQVMKRWDYPTQGTGSHSYNWASYGQITANFGQTTYDWANMPISLGSNSSQTEIDAVATLMYHCGVSVNMMYAPDGSGAYSVDVPDAISSYFGYTSASQYLYRDSYQLEVWQDMLKEAMDCGWPVYYSGQSTEGGHAFVCDGYDDNDLFHFNWGWGGSGDGYFQVDAIDYSSSDGAIMNYVPAEVYNSTPNAPTNLEAIPAANNQLSATLTWTNPTKTLNNNNLNAISQIVVMRDGEVIYTEDNVTPGANMTYVDNAVPRFDSFKYTVYAVLNGAHGRTAAVKNINFGPTCSWSIIMTTSSFQGWRGGYISIYNASGTEVAKATMTNSTTVSLPVDMPLGNVSFGWTAPTQTVNTMSFIIKDSQNATLHTFSGSSDQLTAGIFLESNNTCGNSGSCATPTDMHAVIDETNENNIIVSWTGVDNPGYGYNIYRDGLLYRLIPSATSFVDENVSVGGHCYYVATLCENGENGEYSNESCATAGSGCNAPTNFDFEITGSSFKTKLLWDKPEQHDGLSGYYIYRKAEGGEYERIKLAGASATSYTDNTNLPEGNYYYKIYAYYSDIDCTSAPASWIYDDNQFYLHVYHSPTSVDDNAAENVKVYPNPTVGNFAIEANALNRVSVYNAMGQMVYDSFCDGAKTNVELNVESGIYMVKIYTDHGEVTKRISVVR
jgi:Peptidase C10 family.